jgi:predicted RNase H-like HicB family nuclease
MSLRFETNTSSTTLRLEFVQERPVGTVKNSYRVFLKDGGEGWLVVTSPDIPGLVTQGRNEQEAAKNAVEAASLLLEDQGIVEFNLIVERKY